MNKVQIEYTTDRINEAVGKKLKALRDSKMPADLSNGDRLDLIRKKKVPLKDGVSSYTDVVKAFDFSAFEPSQERIDTAQAAIDKEMAPVLKRAAELKDELVLGDQETALRGLQELQKLCK